MSYGFRNEKHDGNIKFEIWEICAPIVMSHGGENGVNAGKCHFYL